MNFYIGKKIFGTLFILVCLASLPQLPNFLFYAAIFLIVGIFQIRLCPQTNIFYRDNGDGDGAEALGLRWSIAMGSFLCAIIVVLEGFDLMF